MKPHKHAEVIKAWADGAEIEYFWEDRWMTLPRNPMWPIESIYRIKPKHRPDVVWYGVAFLPENGIARVGSLGPFNGREDNNIRLTFDGETGALKSAEVLK